MFCSHTEPSGNKFHSKKWRTVKSDKEVKKKKLSVFFHSSVNATDKWAEVQAQTGIPQHKLIQDVEAQWNATFYMLERTFEQERAVATVLSSRKTWYVFVY